MSNSPAKILRVSKISKRFRRFGTEDLPSLDRQIVVNEEFDAAPVADNQGTWNQISKWLEQCTPQKHPMCHFALKNNSVQYPTRLLDIEAPEQVRLVLSESLVKHPPYTTLSHCWGKAKILTNTAENASRLFAGIPNEDLPKTFREAVMVTRRLGINYIWIDSLCIIQDSKQDWAKESTLMAGIYSGSYCNIAATAASGASEGLFSNEGHRIVEEPGPTELFESVKRNGTPPTLQKTVRIVVTRENWWKEDIELQSLVRRAWVLQERLFAPRTIHFAQRQVYWDCAQLKASEAFPQFNKSERHYGGPWHSDRPKYLVSLHRFGKLRAVDPTTALRDWMHVIEAYTNCDLTFESDRLPAISGLALRMQSLIDSKYSAGLWETHFVTQLVWVSREPGTVPLGYIAPSWSWASVNQAVSFPEEPVDSPKDQTGMALSISGVKVLEVKVTARYGDSMLQVDGGYLQIEAPLLMLSASQLKVTKIDQRWYKDAEIAWDYVVDKHRLGTADKWLFMPLLYVSWADRVFGLILDTLPPPASGYRRIGTVRFIWYVGDPRFTSDEKLPPNQCAYESQRRAHSEELGRMQNFYTFKIF
jgi:hypothetical protein